MVFISHSSKDRTTADAICAHLESAGIKCWIAPRDIEPGTSWTKGIIQALEACRVFVLVFSEHSDDSDHVQREVAKAFSSGLAVIPFRIKNVSPDQNLSYFLDTVQWLDATAPPLEKHLGTLAERVRRLLVTESSHRPAKTLGPEKISIARLPITGSDVFGRTEDISFLDAALANQQVNIVTIVAWGGVGKSTLVNHWLRSLATEHYRAAELVFGWSFYRQGTSGDAPSADEFVDAALRWFGDPDPRIGTSWEKGERLAKLIAHRRTLMVLDGLEPLQNPPGPQEGRLRDPSLQALLRELAAFNSGLCLITTRAPIADIADHEGASALRLELEQLSSDAGAKLLRALGVKGHEAELQTTSDEFAGHCLALTLLGSYLTDAYEGDLRCREEVSARLVDDVRQGVHARKVMASYQSWLGEGPEMSVLRMLGLFDRPVDEKALSALLKPPAISGLTESLTSLSPTEWRRVLAKLRRARLLAGEDPHHRGHLDTHPLVREYFGGQLRDQNPDAWQECNKRLYHYYQTLAPQLPDTFREMEPLFLAVICGCKAGLFKPALREVYIPRIQRGDASFASNVLGVRGALLSTLAHFFEKECWGSLPEATAPEQGLTAEDQLFVLMEAGRYLIHTRGFAAPEARICYQRAEVLCHSLNRPLALVFAFEGQWRYSLVTEKLTTTLQLAKRAYSLAHEQNNSGLMIRAYRALGVTYFFLGDFESARRYVSEGVRIWRSVGVQFSIEEISTPEVICLSFEAIAEWHLGELSFCQAKIAEAISLAKELNDTHGLAVVLWNAAILCHLEHKPAEVEAHAADLVELSTRQSFALWLAGGEIFRGWARSASGNPQEGLSWIEKGLADWRAIGSTWAVPYFLALKAEAFHFAGRTSEALEAIREAQAVVETSEERWWCAELNRLKAVFLTAKGADEAEIETSFHEAIRTANQQTAISLETRAKGTHAEYCRQKGSASRGQGFLLSLW